MKIWNVFAEAEPTLKESSWKKGMNKDEEEEGMTHPVFDTVITNWWGEGLLNPTVTFSSLQ